MGAQPDLLDSDSSGGVTPRVGRPPEPPASVSLPRGSRLDDFEILGELGRGGMGVVYRARQVSLGREVALKVLPSCARLGRTGVQRFRAEAKAAARLHHTNVVSIYAQGEYRGHYYYAMELIDGVGLDTVIRSRPDLLSSTMACGGRSTGQPDGQVDSSVLTITEGQRVVAAPR